MSRCCSFIVCLVACFFLPSIKGGWGGVAYAQNKEGQPRIDSLLAVLSNAGEDTNKVNLLDDLSFTYCTINPDEGLRYGKLCLQLAEQLHWQKGKAGALYNIGANYEVRGSLDSELYYCNRALDINNQTGNKEDAAKNIGNIGNVYLYRGDYSRSLEYYRQALKIFETESDKKWWVATMLSNIGLIYLYRSDYPPALNYFQQALKIYGALGSETGIANVRHNIGSLYFYQKDYTQALEYYQKALKTYKTLGIKTSEANTVSDLGSVYYAQKDYSGAMEYFQKAVNISEALDNRSGMITALYNIGSIYSLRKDYPMSMYYFQKVMKLSREIKDEASINMCLWNIGYSYLQSSNDDLPNGKAIFKTNGRTTLYHAIDYLSKAVNGFKKLGMINELQQTYSSLSHAYKLSGNYQKAYEAQEQYIFYKDSVFNEENARKLTRLEMQYGFDKNSLPIACTMPECRK